MPDRDAAYWELSCRQPPVRDRAGRRTTKFFRRDFVRAFSHKLGSDIREITIEYLNAIFATASVEPGVFSVKLQPYDFTRLSIALEAIPGKARAADLVASWLRDPRYVDLTRRNSARQAISYTARSCRTSGGSSAGESRDVVRPSYPDFLQMGSLEISSPGTW